MFFREAGNWFIQQDDLLNKINNREIQKKINQQVSRALAFGILIGLTLGILILK
jgi:tetrahydromethanopterin S-methyltransferase subunit G